MTWSVQRYRCAVYPCAPAVARSATCTALRRAEFIPRSASDEGRLNARTSRCGGRPACATGARESLASARRAPQRVHAASQASVAAMRVSPRAPSRPTLVLATAAALPALRVAGRESLLRRTRVSRKRALRRSSRLASNLGIALAPQREARAFKARSPRARIPASDPGATTPAQLSRPLPERAPRADAGDGRDDACGRRSRRDTCRRQARRRA